MAFLLNLRCAWPLMAVVTALGAAGQPELHPFLKPADEAIRRVAIRAKDIRRAAEALEDLTIRPDAFPVLTHRTRLTMLKEDASRMCGILTAIEGRDGMEPWQVAAVERISPKCKTLAGAIDAAILLLDRRSDPLFVPTYVCLVGDIRDRIAGIARAADAFVSWADKQAAKR
jgi:hypothetical protein